MPLSGKIFLFFACVLLLHAGMCAQAADKEAGFVRIYNGKDLSGWEVQQGKLSSWKADGELLSCVAPGGGWLRTSKLYSDYVLRLEYRIPKGGNSGVGLRFPSTDDPAHFGMEIQILDDPDPQYANIQPGQHTGSIYYQAPAQKVAAKPPGEWNAYEITCRGPQVKVVLNGQVVNDVLVDRYTEGKGGHKPLSERPEIGYIGLQSHGSKGEYHKVDFRNIEVKDLTTQTPTGLQYIDLIEGTGKSIPAGAMVEVHYTGSLVDGTKFEKSRDAKIPLTGVIDGLQEGITGMKVGGRRKLIIPPQLGYGAKGHPGTIPPNATLVFDVEVTKLRTE